MQQAGVLSGRASLVDRIQKAIGFYKDKAYKPPFTPDELFAMAIAVTGRPVTKGQVLKWVFANFKHYRRMLEDEFVDDDPKSLLGVGYWGRPERDSDRARMSISDVTKNYEMYLATETLRNGLERYTMTVASCERILSRKLLSSKQGPDRKAFRFLDLPSELRNAIFDLLFQYPRSGLLFAQRGQKTATIDSPADRETHPRTKYNTLPKTARIADTLAPLLVNKQFYEEAKACFFAVNHFSFGDNYVAAVTLGKIPEPQRRHIQHITLRYQVDSHDLRYAKETIALLATCRLKKFNLHLPEAEWRRSGITRRGKVLKNRNNVLNLPGLRRLRTMRGLEEVNFHECPTVEALIKADMLKPTPKPKKKGTSGTKRKAEGDGEGGKKSIRR